MEPIVLVNQVAMPAREFEWDYKGGYFVMQHTLVRTKMALAILEGDAARDAIQKREGEKMTIDGVRYYIERSTMTTDLRKRIEYYIIEVVPAV